MGSLGQAFESAVNDRPATRSLIPYFDPASTGVYLELPLLSEEPEVLGYHDFPFCIVDNGDPFTRIIEACFVSNAGSRVKSVFLLVQKDAYTASRSTLRPVNNKDVESFWCNAYLNYSRAANNNHPILFSSQLDERGGLRSLLPLFFCKTSRRFFHPPCPVCGAPLDQCENDDLLSQSGLAPYSTSLSRYLLCPSCCLSGEKSCFYAYSMEGCEAGRARDWKGLVREYGVLLRNEGGGKGLPCPECSHRPRCAAECEAVGTAMIPFSFYPFFMFAFDAATFKVADFSFLLSGASWEDLEAKSRENGEPGRIASLRAVRDSRSGYERFLFEGEERLFLEVLYLKLALLGELMPLIGGGGGSDLLERVDSGTILDRAWVRLSDQAGLLPSFWNFQVQLLQIEAGGAYSRSSPSSAVSEVVSHELGLIWFYILLANRNVDIRGICEGLKPFLEARPVLDDSLVLAGLAETFGPENLFWNPRNEGLGDHWPELWSKALYLGYSLLRGGSTRTGPWSMGALLDELRTLMDTIRLSLFTSYAAPAVSEDAGREDEAIRSILDELAATWRKEILSKNESAAQSGPEGNIPSTCDLRGVEHTERLTAFEAPEPEPPATLILSSVKTPVRSISESSPDEMISRKDEALHDDEAKSEEATESEVIPETVILRPLSPKGARRKDKP